MNPSDTTVFVGMSGGVDSSVAAALLVERGFDVVGCYIRCWSGPTCTWERDIRDARAVADQLDIPFYVINLEREYRERVVGEMLAEYEAGRTPNPDVACNREIKFGLFLKKAKALGADMIATGHYARIASGGESNVNGQMSNVRLLAGVDDNKDQSYFLWTLGQEALRHTLFPVGDLTKPEVRAIAEKYNFVTADKKDSQGVCFIGEIDVAQFLREHIPQERGPIVTTDGEQVGEHDGAWFYTIGQRHGLGIGGGTPYYVVATDNDTNTVIVGENDDPALFARELVATDMHWVAGEPPNPSQRYTTRIRYRQPTQQCWLQYDNNNDNDTVRVVFDEPQRAITPGQSVVIYDSDKLLGGGIISHAVQQQPSSIPSRTAAVA